MFKIIKVAGKSLSPKYNEGDYLITCCIPFVLRSLKPDDMVVFKHPVYGTMVKQVQQIDLQTGEIFVVGLHPESTDSRQFGPIPRGWVNGKVLWHISKIG